MIIVNHHRLLVPGSHDIWVNKWANINKWNYIHCIWEFTSRNRDCIQAHGNLFFEALQHYFVLSNRHYSVSIVYFFPTYINNMENGRTKLWDFIQNDKPLLLAGCKIAWGILQMPENPPSQIFIFYMKTL